MPALFITGTDTGVGKTHITAAIARTLRRQGHPVLAIKPVATGCDRVGERWLGEDTRILADACGADVETITRWSFPDPVAPPVAAEKHGVTWSLADFVAEVQNHLHPDRFLLVEGVGGLLCPLTAQETVADWIAALKMPTIVVARRSLGTLNHTLLTLEVAEHRGLDVRGVIVNETTAPNSLAETTNVNQLRARIRVPILSVFPYRPAGTEPPMFDAVDWIPTMMSKR